MRNPSPSHRGVLADAPNREYWIEHEAVNSSMSQQQSSTDTNVLLQSMLQRLRIQQERGTQAFSHATLPTGAASTVGQVGESGVTSIQTGCNSPVNGFGFYNGTSPKEVRTFGVGGNFSFPDQKYSFDKAGSPEDAGVASSDGADAQRVSATGRTSDAGQSLGQTRGPEVFTSKVFSWSPKSTDVRNGPESPERKGPVVGNEGSECLEQSKDAHTVQTDQNSTNSLSRRKPRTSGNRARRWTQKIKEKWRDRPGSFGKKSKEEPREEEQSEHRTTVSIKIC